MVILTSNPTDGVSTPRPRSTSRVRFDLDSNIAHSPEATRRKDDAKRGDPSEQRDSDTEQSDERKHRRRSKRKGKERERDGHDSHRDEGKKHERRGHDRGHDRDRNRDRDRGDNGNDSDDTVDLPDRFDENGNRKPEDPLAQKINELLAGQGGAGNLFKGLVGGLLGGQGGGGDDDDEGRSSRRRHRERR